MVVIGIITAVGILYRKILPIYQSAYPHGRITAGVLNRMIPVILVSSLAGARILAVLLSWEYYRLRPMEILLFWRGGLVFHGGFAAAAAAALYSCRRSGMHPGELLDMLSVPLCIGYSLGRIGCFLNGCCAGIPSQLPWAMEFPLFGSSARHPTQIYAALFAGGCFFLLLHIYKHSTWRYQTVSWMLLLMGSYRFFIEFLRDEQTVLAGLRAGQIGGLVMTAASAVLFYRYGAAHANQ